MLSESPPATDCKSVQFYCSVYPKQSFANKSSFHAHITYLYLFQKDWIIDFTTKYQSKQTESIIKTVAFVKKFLDTTKIRLDKLSL